MTPWNAAPASGDGRGADAVTYSAVDRAHMARALALAARGLYTTTPNPRVGCVIARSSDVIGEGWHLRAGGDHAEVAGLRDARARENDVRGAALYVTLAPCNAFGRTPPCVDAIIAAGIGRVVAAMRDPVAAQANGLERLRSAGIAVDVGLLEEDARELNPGFVSRVTRGLPWVRCKVAASLDGRTALAGGESQWITGQAARDDGHAWRARACAVLTGVGTVLHDDPRLDVRAVVTPRQPLRIIVDRNGDVPANARILEGGGALIVTAGACSRVWPAGVEVLEVPDANGRVDLRGLLQALAGRGMNEIHVEAGARLNGALLHAGLVDEIVAYLAGAVIGDPARGMFELPEPLAALGSRTLLHWKSVDRIGTDLRLVARIARPEAH